MVRRKICVGLLLLLLIMVVPVGAWASDLSLTAESALLMEASTGRILYQKEPNLRLPPASVTKVMTLLLIMEALDAGQIKLTDKIRTSEYAASMGGSQIWLEPGEEMTLDDMLKAIAVVSANDASVAVAEHLAGSVEAFVRKMNERAQALGMKHTHYTNPTGLPAPAGEEGTLTTAYDVALLSRELLKHPKILEYTKIWMGNLHARPEPALVNTNRLVHFYPGCDGLKTGYTSESKYCLAATAEREKVRLIAVVMKAPTVTVRNAEIAKLFDYGFAQLVAHSLARKGQEVGIAQVARGVQTEVKVQAGAELLVVLKREEAGKIETELKLAEKITAPVAAGQEVGKLIAKKDGQVLAQVPVLASDVVPRANIFLLFFRFLTNFWRVFFK